MQSLWIMLTHIFMDDFADMCIGMAANRAVRTTGIGI